MKLSRNNWNSGKIKITITSQDGEPGDIFYGNINQFRDCFFDNAGLVIIIGWANKNKYQVGVNGVVLNKTGVKNAISTLS